jgi:hypothetical protein
VLMQMERGRDDATPRDQAAADGGKGTRWVSSLVCAYADAMVIDADLDVVTNMLKSWASAAPQTVEATETDVAALNLRMLDSLRAASLEEWAAAVTEARRRGAK